MIFFVNDNYSERTINKVYMNTATREDNFIKVKQKKKGKNK